MKYKNVSNQELTVIGIGTVPAGGTVDVGGEFRNPNFRMEEEQAASPTPPAPQPQVPAAPEPHTEQANQD